MGQIGHLVAEMRLDRNMLLREVLAQGLDWSRARYLEIESKWSNLATIDNDREWRMVGDWIGSECSQIGSTWDKRIRKRIQLGSCWGEGGVESREKESQLVDKDNQYHHDYTIQSFISLSRTSFFHLIIKRPLRNC